MPIVPGVVRLRGTIRVGCCSFLPATPKKRSCGSVKGVNIGWEWFDVGETWVDQTLCLHDIECNQIRGTDLAGSP